MSSGDCMPRSSGSCMLGSSGDCVPRSMATPKCTHEGMGLNVAQEVTITRKVWRPVKQIHKPRRFCLWNSNGRGVVVVALDRAKL